MNAPAPVIGNHPVEKWVEVDGHRLTTYSYGSGEQVLFALNGGPGLPSLAIRTGLLPVVDHGYRLVSYDQLGTGDSDRPTDIRLWDIERYALEVEKVRTRLALDRIHLLGHSWGGWLAIEYAVTYPDKIASLVLEGTCADMRQFISEARRLCRALGTETEAMMRRHEVARRFDHPEYLAAVSLLNHRHVWRVNTDSELMRYQFDRWNKSIYEIMQGPNEFFFNGNLRNWTRLAELARVRCPVLIVVGEHDHITPACSRHMQAALPNARLQVFDDCGHGVMREAPERYFPVLLDFLDNVGR